MAARWRLSLIGIPRLLPSDASVRAITLARKDAGWLAYVALQSQAASTTLAALLWPDADARGALNNLRQRVHRLRRTSGARLVEMGEAIGLAGDLVIEPVPGRAELEADREAGEGDLLGAFEYDDAPEFAAWLAAVRSSARAARCELLAAIASDAERSGQLARALVYAQHLAAENPLSEHAHRRVMRLHYLRGDSTAAIAAFEVFERTVKDELGARPSTETIALLHTVEQSLPVPTAAGSTCVNAPLPASLSRPPRLVGRGAAQAELALAWQQAQIAVVVGEAGMGKTRLLQELLAGQGDAALHVAARPGDGTVPYALLSRTFHAMHAAGLGSVERGLPTLASVHRLRPALEVALSGAVAQGLRTLALDDLHFADAPSIELLMDVAIGGSVPVLRWVAAQRPDAVGDAPRVLALAQSPQVRFVALAPLDVEQLQDFVASLGIAAFDAQTLAAPLAHRTGGNPLFVIETLRATLAAPMPSGGVLTLAKPAGLNHLIDERLRRLSRSALALARVAAIAAPDFDLMLAEEVLGVPPIALADAWHELEEAQVLRGEAFAHDLVQEALLRATPQVIAAHTHRQVAAWLAQRGGAPARLAQHWMAGGEPGQAARAFASAAAQVSAAGRPREHAELLECCARAHEAAGEVEAALRVRIDRVSTLLHDRGVDTALAAADALADACRDTPLAAHLLAARAIALAIGGGRLGEAEDAARQALAAAAPGDDEVRIAASGVLANACAMRGDGAEGLALLLPWRDRIDGVASLAARRDLFGNLTNLLLQCNRNAEALETGHRHLELARASGHGGEQVSALMNVSNVHGRRGDLVRAIDCCRQAAQLIPESEQAAMLGPWNGAYLGYWLAGTGRFGEALALLEEAGTVFSTGPVALRQTLQGLLARVWITLGQTARAAALVRAMVELPSGRMRAAQCALQATLDEALGLDATPAWREAAANDVAGAPPRIAAEIALAAAAGDAAGLLSWQRQAEQVDGLPFAADAATLRLALLTEPNALALALPAAEQLVLTARSPVHYLPGQLLRCAEAWRRLDHEADARRCERTALDWVYEQALPHVPPPFVDSFLHRNPVNAALRAVATRPSRD